MNRLMTAMAACGEPAFVQLALTPAPALLRAATPSGATSATRRTSSRERRERPVRARPLAGRGGRAARRPGCAAPAAVLRRPARASAPTRRVCERIASELRAEGAENRLVERGTAVRHGLLGLYRGGCERGEGNPLPSLRKGVFASTELAALWQLPSIDYATVPFARSAAAAGARAARDPAPARAGGARCATRYGPVSIHPQMRRQNTAVPGTVEQGKSSYLVATVAEDLRRERCAVIVLDPKGDAAEAAVSLVPAERTCTLLDFAHPDLRLQPARGGRAGGHDRRLRGGGAEEPLHRCGHPRLLGPLPAQRDHRRARLRPRARRCGTPRACCRWARRATPTARASARACARCPSSRRSRSSSPPSSPRSWRTRAARPRPSSTRPSTSSRGCSTRPRSSACCSTTRCTVDFDRVIAGAEVLVVKGALGAMGAGNTSVLMQLLVGMLDAALARQQDSRRRRAARGGGAEGRRGAAGAQPRLRRDDGAEALRGAGDGGLLADRRAVDRARGARRSSTRCSPTACTSRRPRSRDARAPASLMMAEFSDTVRPGHQQPLGARPPRRAPAPAQAPRDRELEHAGGAPGAVHRAARSRCASTASASRCTPRARPSAAGASSPTCSQPHWERREADPGRGGARGGSQVGASARAGGERAGWGLGLRAPPRSWRARPGSGEPRQRCTERGVDCGAVAGAAAERCPSGALTPAEALPDTAAESYRELVDLDAAHSVRWARSVASPRPLEPDPLDLEILALVAAMRHVLTSQIHRRFNPRRAATTTQRRLKRLSDAGLVGRFQFHRRDGGGAPMCYVIAGPGSSCCGAHERLDDLASARSMRHVTHPPDPNPLTASLAASAPSSLPVAGDRRLRQARHDVHVTGWALALERALGAGALRLRGPGESVLSPPLRSTPDGRVAIGPGELRLPGGRAAARLPAHRPRPAPRARWSDSRRCAPTRSSRFPAERSSGSGRRWSDRGPPADRARRSPPRRTRGRQARALRPSARRLGGVHTPLRRGGAGRAGSSPVVVFVCRDRARARECARRADHVLRACRAYAGEYPRDWEYPGRAGSCSPPSATSTRGCCTPTASPACRPRCASPRPTATLGRANGGRS